MSDRELLEMAAKAAGYQIHVWGTKGDENVARMDVAGHPRWNPLTDDGDALRLLVKLRMTVVFPHHLPDQVNAHAKGSELAFFEYLRDDIDAAMRRIIVRAAADIGKAMP